MKIPLKMDVTGCADWPQGFPAKVELATTVCLPDQPRSGKQPILLFAFPGGGYSRHYFDLDLSHLPGCEGASYSQADHHLASGIIVVTCDHLHVGESTKTRQPELITLDMLAAANAAMVDAVSSRLADGTLVEAAGPNAGLRCVGLGQSMGGAITIATQAAHGCFDAIAVLAHGVHGSVAVRPEDLDGLSATGRLAFSDKRPGTKLPSMRELWYAADVPQAIIDEDTKGGYPVRQTTPVYGSLTIPPCALNFIAPGFLASKAAKISVPVFIGYGDTDVLAEPDHEPAAYRSAASVEAAKFATMGHMHNFASTRQQLWDKLVAWMQELASERAEEATR
ncbi:MAG: hypothetical protein OXH92_01090 [Bryobacterales bacterium]|nr:hypothetical protein [Gammaproteobacteria bacterium]MDE0432578.1 hypothetical protein [Bryobacterales bacterium]